MCKIALFVLFVCSWVCLVTAAPQGINNYHNYHSNFELFLPLFPYFLFFLKKQFDLFYQAYYAYARGAPSTVGGELLQPAESGIVLVDGTLNYS